MSERQDRDRATGRTIASVRRTLGTVRVRLFMLLVAVTLPLVTLTMLTTMQNARLRHRENTESVRLARASAVATGDPAHAPGRIWRVTLDSVAHPLNATTPAEDAPAAMTDVLAHGSDGVSTNSVGGRPMSYATLSPTPDNLLLFGLPRDRDVGGSDALLGRRMAEVAILLLVGFAAVAYGADRLVATPVRSLGRAVEQWSVGGRFEAPPADLAGGDIRALWTSFEHATDAVTRRERQLHTATTRQKLLMQEIHHRVKNNLQIVASLLNLQATRIRVPEARAEFQAARDRIRALATLHRHLYAFGELHMINMRAFLIELCEQLLAALGETPAGGRISLAIDAPELQISSDQAVPIALIVTECVSNAAKYAFPGGRSGHISVSMTVVREQGDDVGHLRIDDDGIGIPAGRGETGVGTHDGIGLNLIRGFAKQLGAAVHITHEFGTRYDIAIPLIRVREPDPGDESLAG